MAICTDCNQEMQVKSPCTLTRYDDFPDGIARDRTPFSPDDTEAHCHDCSVPAGGFHHPGCDVERCPSCHGQAISCPCGNEDDD